MCHSSVFILAITINGLVCFDINVVDKKQSITTENLLVNTRLIFNLMYNISIQSKKSALKSVLLKANKKEIR